MVSNHYKKGVNSKDLNFYRLILSFYKLLES